MTAKRSQKKKTEEDIHVKIDSPKWLRKEILTTAIDLISALRKYETFVELNKHKEHLLKLLKAEMAEIRNLMQTLKLKELPLSPEKFNQLPIIKEEAKEVEMRRKEAEQAEKEVEKDIHKRRRAIAKIEETKPIDSLEADLMALRKKLSLI
ncbi:MAG: hypothetical protein KKA65_05010 [Nanoarchaeota archaeon]|nr:hypothetical protein [Nanoarchaeota archaeon]MBU4241922.1 hypothetical protein [Nanoarchaeota archaeon]MBU4351977.1 hypothetical protein [Nanoarchaeota archaeon]MBU4456835.1 hypothetical protein [Nanoarchaeota archaeon]MCG2719865.1 hypothetical protein [Nanoarchaeota archaeon]